jgi:hypothetical protein
VSKKKKILVILLAVLLAILLYKFLVPVPRQRVKTLTYTGETYKNRLHKTIPSEKSPRIDLLVRTDILNKPSFNDTEVKRDLFYPQQEATNMHSIEGENVSKDVSVEPAPRHMAEIELPQYAFFGSLVKEGIKTIFLSKEDEIYLVRKGKKLDKNYIISNINAQTMTLLLPNTNEEIKVRLQEDAPLRVIKIKKLDTLVTYKGEESKNQK